LLILAAGMFPLQAIIGQGASEVAWKATYLVVFALVGSLTVIATRGWQWQLLSFTSLTTIALWAYHFPKIGVAFMPALDEGTTLDMPITVPRASVTQAADDLKARDALLRGFPEVESVIGKAGRADTPTDPAPLDMVETFVNFRPREFWPKRVLRFDDALWQTQAALKRLEQDGYIAQADTKDGRASLLNDATQKALERFDESQRELALSSYRGFEQSLGPVLVHYAVEKAVGRFVRSGSWIWPPDQDRQRTLDEIAQPLIQEFGPWLGSLPALEDVTQLVRSTLDQGVQRGFVSDPVRAQEVHQNAWHSAVSAVQEAIGARRPTFASEMLGAVVEKRHQLWLAQVRQTNWELSDHGVQAYTWYALEELARAAQQQNLTVTATHGAATAAFADASLSSQLGQSTDPASTAPFLAVREELERPFANRVFLWQRRTGPKGDLVDDEMGRVLQVPGWSNIFTQPIINRIEMLSTGVRTDIGVKVFGEDLDTIDGVCKKIEAVLKPLSGARDAIASPIMGKGYLDIDINREAAARYGISIEDIQNEIEMALAGRAVTYTVEKRERFPVRVRYARSARDDIDSIKRLLVSAGSMSSRPMVSTAEEGMSRSPGGDIGTLAANSTQGDGHSASPGHARSGRPLIPLSTLADIKIVEGPAMIKSENGRLLNYVTLNVRGRDIVGFVEEARRVVGEKVKLPEGVHIEWSGEFEHQVRAAQTLRFVFPAVIALIFLILYLTYRDLADAALMMLTVPEALAGGAFFMYLFPKIMQGWDAPPMDFSVAVWVGFIACFGMATETGIIMLVYLREAIEKRGGLEKIASLEELRQAVIEGAVHRLRPKLLTEGVAIIAIFPMVFARGVGGEILAPMALPVLGGLLISDEVVDLFLPVRFYWVRRARWLKLHPPVEVSVTASPTPAAS
ncbi:MAG: efflux RND transporter permease subunit, partial [Planctomycetaceae bacterium]|nr:efflux RND transporter permease subunit [Planctomycetaceae bacterium]